MLTDEAKQAYTATLDTAERLLVQGASWGSSLRALPAEVQEASQILKSVETQLPEIERQDPAFYAVLFNRVETMWAQYVKVSNLGGLGALADLSLRCR